MHHWRFGAAPHILGTSGRVLGAAGGVRCVFSDSFSAQMADVGAQVPSARVDVCSAGQVEQRRVPLLKRLLQAPQILLNDLTTTFFPADCRACGGPLLALGAVPVCRMCLEGLTAQTRTLCGRCGEALGASLDLEDLRFAGMLPEGLLCTLCRTVPPDFVRAAAFGEYRDELRTLIHLLKYERIAGVGRSLALYLAETIAGFRADAAAELLVIAVPLFPAKERQRGYNQSVLLADAALKLLRKSHPEWRLTAAHGLLQRVRWTEDQFTLTPKGRRRNLKGAFRVKHAQALAGREILLVDDIFTTGATARECARVLVRAGAAKVWVATVARAQSSYVAPLANEFALGTAAWTLPPTDVPQVRRM